MNATDADILTCPGFASMYKALDLEIPRGADELSLLCGAGVSELRSWLRYAVSNNLAVLCAARPGPGAPRMSYCRTASAPGRLAELTGNSVESLERFVLCPPFSRIKPTDPISDEETRWFCARHMHRVAPFLKFCQEEPVAFKICEMLKQGPLPLPVIVGRLSSEDPTIVRRTVRKLDYTFKILSRSGRCVRLSIELRPLLKFVSMEVF